MLKKKKHTIINPGRCFVNLINLDMILNMIKRHTIFMVLLAVLFGSFTSPESLYAQKKQKAKAALTENDLLNRKSLFFDANKERILGNTDKAEVLFKRVLEIDPNHDASMYELARIYMSQVRIEDAVLLMENAIRIAPENVWYQLLLADLYRFSRQYDKVVDVFKKLTELYPDKVDYYFDLALSYIIIEDYKEAIVVYDKIESLIGVSEEISIQKQKLYQSINKPAKAIEEIQKLVKANPDNSRYLQILAESYMSEGNDKEALKIYEKIALVDPENPYIRISLSDFYRKNGDEQKAFEELKKGFANPALDLQTKIQILLSYYSLDQFYNEKKEQAYELSEILVKTHPDDPKALSIYGDLLYRNEQFEEAHSTFSKALKYDSSNYAIWEQMMFIENEMKKFDQLYQTSQTAIQLFPMQPLPFLFNGFANMQLKNYELALKSFESGVLVVVDNDLLLAQFYSSLGDVYNQLKDHKKSDDAYDKALRIKPDDAYVLNNYSYYLSLRNEKLDKAREMARKATELSPENPSFQDTFGWVLYKLGEYEEAEKWIKKAIDNEEADSAVELEHYGDVLYRLNRKNEAFDYWQKAKQVGGEASEFLDKKIRDKKLYE
jgi:tetratricopeptide (TPR) repeat protein